MIRYVVIVQTRGGWKAQHVIIATNQADAVDRALRAHPGGRMVEVKKLATTAFGEAAE